MCDLFFSAGCWLLGILVQGHFVDIGIKAQGGLQSICNTMIRKILYSQVYPEIVITDIKKIPVFFIFAGEIPVTHTLAA
jgi:hypothetical protein